MTSTLSYTQTQVIMKSHGYPIADAATVHETLDTYSYYHTGHRAIAKRSPDLLQQDLRYLMIQHMCPNTKILSVLLNVSVMRHHYSSKRPFEKFIPTTMISTGNDYNTDYFEGITLHLHTQEIRLW